MNSDEAVERLLHTLPEFAPDYEASLAAPTEPGDEVLIHVVMGDLARFYMEKGLKDGDLAARYWAVVEELAANGDEAVENALYVSLIEWFAWGEHDEQAALRDAESMQGMATRKIVAHFANT